MKIDIEKLKSKTIFVGLADEQIEAILGFAEERSAQGGEVILNEKEPGDSLYVILKGKVEIHHFEAGEDRLLASLSGSDNLAAQYEGDFFGEMSLLDTEPRAASVVAAEPAELLVLTRDRLAELFEKDLRLQVVLFGNIARVLSRRIRVSIPRVK
ncbi:MAG: cyclic nucleotide-binding domain-containing protein [bacterium]